MDHFFHEQNLIRKRGLLHFVAPFKDDKKAIFFSLKMCLQDRSQPPAAACINVEEGGKGDFRTVCLHAGELPPVKRQVVGFAAVIGKHGTNHMREELEHSC